MLDLLADFPSASARALTYAFAKAAHAFAQVFATAYRPAVRNVFTKMFAAVPRALACVFIRVSDAGMSAPVSPAAPVSVRHVQDPLVLIILQAINRCGYRRDRNWSRKRREKDKE
jgi:hypothetical protein